MVNLYSSKLRDDSIMHGIAACGLIIEHMLAKSFEIKPFEKEPLMPENSYTMHMSVKLVSSVAEVLKFEQLTAEALEAAMRLLVLATRYSDASRKFIDDGGLDLLSKASDQVTFSGFTSMMMLVIRHAIETETVLQAMFEAEFLNWFTVPRDKAVATAVFVKNFASAISRNHVAFVDATSHVCR